MKVKIRCDGCGKQIAVDEAFVGGVCRCPFCKALVSIDGPVSTDRDGARPQAPDREGGRPETPSRDVATRHVGSSLAGTPASQGQDELAAQAARQKQVPLASPVKIRGWVALALGVVLLAIVTVFVVVAIQRGLFAPTESSKKTHKPIISPGPRPMPPRPATAPSPERPAPPGYVLGDMRIDSPVIYCVEAGGGDPAIRAGVAVLLRESVRSLGTTGKFDIVACADGKAAVFDGLYRQGGPRGAAQAEEFLAGLAPTTPAPLAEGLATAVRNKPATVVVLAWSNLNAGDSAARAKGAKVRIVTVGVQAGAGAGATLQKLADETGGQCRLIDEGQLKEFIKQAGLPRREPKVP